uniref:Uncharacterized protein n=1 Tax=Anguilla anguilla TaxID=7936 RepID=A0A0E9VTC5_ANGAN
MGKTATYQSNRTNKSDTVANNPVCRKGIFRFVHPFFFFFLRVFSPTFLLTCPF